MITPLAQVSIRRRLLMSLLASAAVLAVVVFFVVQSVARQVAQESQDNILAASAMAILDSARFSGGQLNVDLPYSALSMLDGITDERVFYAIWLEKDFLSGYENLPRAKGNSNGRAAFVSADFLDVAVRIATVDKRVSTDDSQKMLYVSVAQTLSGQQQTLAKISQSAMSVGAAFFLVSVLLAAMIARSTIRPLDRLALSVSRRGPKDLRPVSAPVPTEMIPLVASLNSFMKRLQRSLVRSEDFIAEAAHRVRTPLAIVRTKAEIVQRQTDDPQTLASLGEMIHAIDVSSRTAGQLLDHAMVTFRLDHLVRVKIDLRRLVQDTVERSRPMSELKDIEITIEEAQDATLDGDPILLQNAILNLLDNAVKYTPSGSLVKVRLSRDDAHVWIDINDNGPGFPEAEMKHLMGRFERGGNTENVVGSGLGLTIVKEVVEAHGGRLKIENNHGGGACVSLLFPLS